MSQSLLRNPGFSAGVLRTLGFLRALPRFPLRSERSNKGVCGHVVIAMATVVFIVPDSIYCRGLRETERARDASNTHVLLEIEQCPYTCTSAFSGTIVFYDLDLYVCVSVHACHILSNKCVHTGSQAAAQAAQAADLSAGTPEPIKDEEPAKGEPVKEARCAQILERGWQGPRCWPQSRADFQVA